MESEKSIRILVAGDFAPNGPVQDAYLFGKHKFFDQGILEVLLGKDLSLFNLEVPLTDANSPIKKVGPNLKARPEIVELIKQAGFDVACLANNHIWDYDEKGLRDTLDVCHQNGIATVGAGLSLQDATKAFYRNVKGMTVAIVNFSENEFSNASPVRGGANPMDIIDNLRQIQNARMTADIVLVIVHGGHEYYQYPSPRIVKQYRFYVENGADAVVAHHSHCIGPYEMYKGKPIVYSLGNFFFPANTAPQSWHEGFLAQLTFRSPKPPVLRIIPYQQCHNNENIVRSLKSDELIDLERKITALCSVLNDPAKLDRKWNIFVDSEYLSCLGQLSMIGRWRRALLRRQPWLIKLLNKHKLRVMQNHISCEAHRDLSKAVLKKYLDI